MWAPINHWACRFARRAAIPYLVAPRGMLEPWGMQQKRFKKRLAWLSYQKADVARAACLHATAEQEASNLRALGFKNLCAVVANGVDLNDGDANCQRSQRQALFLSRIHQKKGLPTLVEAWHRIRPANWRCIVAGPDENGHLGEVKTLVRARGLESSFEFLPEISDDDKWQLYRSADLFVLPTHSENFGLVVAEALSCGVPVITTTAAPWKDLQDHRCGWWIPDSVERLAATLRDATSAPPESLQRMGARGRGLIRDKYSWDSTGTRMLDVYRWLVEGCERPDFVV